MGYNPRSERQSAVQDAFPEARTTLQEPRESGLIAIQSDGTNIFCITPPIYEACFAEELRQQIVARLRQALEPKHSHEQSWGLLFLGKRSQFFKIHHACASLGLSDCLQTLETLSESTLGTALSRKENVDPKWVRASLVLDQRDADEQGLTVLTDLCAKFGLLLAPESPFAVSVSSNSPITTSKSILVNFTHPVLPIRTVVSDIRDVAPEVIRMYSIMVMVEQLASESVLSLEDYKTHVVDCLLLDDVDIPYAPGDAYAHILEYFEKETPNHYLRSVYGKLVRGLAPEMHALVAVARFDYAGPSRFASLRTNILQHRNVDWGAVYAKLTPPEVHVYEESDKMSKHVQFLAKVVETRPASAKRLGKIAIAKLEAWGIIADFYNVAHFLSPAAKPASYDLSSGMRNYSLLGDFYTSLFADKGN